MISGLKAEDVSGRQVDAVMFRITSAQDSRSADQDAAGGIPVRLITDQAQYRNTSYFWDSYNVDRMYMAGIPVKWKDKSSGQDMHQKSILMYSRGLAVFGSSNWTASSSDTQREHNYFSKKPWFFQWFVDQFNRKWNNVKVDGARSHAAMFQDFVPGFPETPVYVSPNERALGRGHVRHPEVGGRVVGAQVRHLLRHLQHSTPPAVRITLRARQRPGVSNQRIVHRSPILQPGVTYYWRIVSKTMANGTRPDGTSSAERPGRPTASRRPAAARSRLRRPR